MQGPLVTYLSERSDASAFLLRAEIPRVLGEIFDAPESTLPHPYKIFLTDETLPHGLGFPVNESTALRDLQARLDKWIEEEILWQLRREPAKERAVSAFSAYFGHLMKLAENAMLSSLIADYHGVFWLAHSIDLAAALSNLSKKISIIDSNAARTQGDALRYRIFGKWASEARDQMSRLAARVSPILEGEEERGLRFFKILQENVLIMSEEFIGPDLRELRSFFNGYLHRDFNPFKESLERIRITASALLEQDSVFRGALGLLGIQPQQEMPTALLMDARFQRFLFEHPQIERVTNRDERDQFQLVSRRVVEFAVLHELRRGITWMRTIPSGEVVSADRRLDLVYSRSTRPIDFGRLGVVDPMVHRFGLMYDITAFSETLGTIAKTGRKGEMTSYRQMLAFQKKIETVARRHRLQFEKFLGDGAFYTTRRATALIRAAIEIQLLYSEMRRKGFAFDKGLRIALNYGYYRLLPMKGGSEGERSMEFYGPGVVELSRLTTGKATRELEEIQSFLLAHGYESANVQQFFAPLAKGVDLVDRKMHQREFYAYVNSNGHLVNEGIVASLPLLQELSEELAAGSDPHFRLTSSFGTYTGFVAEMETVGYIGLRLLGSVSLKGLSDIEVGEIVPFSRSEVEASPLERDSLVTILRQQYHERDEKRPPRRRTTEDREVQLELVLCTADETNGDATFVIGSWDPLSDEIRESVHIPRIDLENMLGTKGPLTAFEISQQKHLLEEIFRNHPKSPRAAPLYLDSFRRSSHFLGFVIGERVEQL